VSSEICKQLEVFLSYTAYPSFDFVVFFVVPAFRIPKIFSLVSCLIETFVPIEIVGDHRAVRTSLKAWLQAAITESVIWEAAMSGSFSCR